MTLHTPQGRQRPPGLGESDQRATSTPSPRSRDQQEAPQRPRAAPRTLSSRPKGGHAVPLGGAMLGVPNRRAPSRCEARSSGRQVGPGLSGIRGNGQEAPHLLLGLEDIAPEDVAGPIASDVAEDLQVLRVVGHVEDPAGRAGAGKRARGGLAAGHTRWAPGTGPGGAACREVTRWDASDTARRSARRAGCTHPHRLAPWKARASPPRQSCAAAWTPPCPV